MIEHYLIVLTTEKDETGVGFLDQYLVPCRLNRQCMVS
jgi:hypothetical protein